MDYDAWNRALAEHFFAIREAAAPVYLSVDDALLADLLASQTKAAATLPAAACDFRAALRSVVFGRNPFDGVASRARQWRRQGGIGTPPFIAVLAATVLAASRMNRSENTVVGRFSYYGPLRELLGLHEGSGMPDGYDVIVPTLWDHLKWWLTERERGRRGLPSAIPHPTQVNIGWSLSQAVLVGSDRVQVGLFLSTIGAQPGDTVPETELLARFQEWVRLNRPSPRIQRALASPQLRPILASILQQELTHYDGLPRNAAGLPHVPLSLTTEAGGFPYGIAARIPSHVRLTSLSLNGDVITVPPGAQWLPLAPPDSKLAPGSALELTAAAATLTLPARDLYVLQANELVGRWTSVTTAEVGVPHRVLVKNAYAAQAEAAMLACGSAAVRRPRRVQVPPGWTLFSGYTPTRSAPVSGVVGPLAPLHQQLARLSGGLRIEGGRQTYLLGYAPDLVLPATPDGHPPTVTVNGIPLPPLHLDAPDTIRLADLVQSVGEHQIQVGNRKLTFALVERYRENVALPVLALPPRNKKLATIPSKIRDTADRSARTPWLPAGHLSGSFFGGSPRDPLPSMSLMRIGGSIYALGKNRRVAQLVPQVPSWIAAMDHVPHAIDIEPLLDVLPFQALWVLQVTSSQNARVRRAPAVQSHSHGAPSGSWKSLSRADWDRLTSGNITVPATCAQGWTDYMSGK
ncbi:hypothetical protein AVW11_10905 [Streptomyces amritsarensis]|uniref:Uncharacterized protein n=1 Tax=Streptomyces amritsarensis TaxID=681158 RepID=A0ABX3G742_9ACTN|nr:hypothetical protein [Streptomyces amritsarensis]OLZ69102.1 hypothetical protein AVW11_10905 [Streptomyces amritsarensis]